MDVASVRTLTSQAERSELKARASKNMEVASVRALASQAERSPLKVRLAGVWVHPPSHEAAHHTLSMVVTKAVFHWSTVPYAAAAVAGSLINQSAASCKVSSSRAGLVPARTARHMADVSDQPLHSPRRGRTARDWAMSYGADFVMGRPTERLAAKPREGKNRGDGDREQETMGYSTETLSLISVYPQAIKKINQNVVRE